MHFPTRIALLSFLSCLTPLADALGQTPDGINILAGGSVQVFDYREYDDQGRLLDEEKGNLPGVLLEVNRSKDQWLLAGKLAYFAGDVTYTGQTNSGVPITSVTKQQIVKMELRAEYWLAESTEWNSALYFGTARQSWRRDIQPTFTASGTPVRGLLETYQWWQIFLGTKVMLHEANQSSWLLDARLNRNLSPTLTVDFSGLYDTSQLNLGERWGIRVSLPWSYSMSRSAAMFVEPFVERSAFGRSAATPLTSHGTTIGSVFEPDSVSNNYGLSVGIREHF